MTSKKTLKTNLTYSCGLREGKREGYAKGYNDAKFDIKSKIVTFCIKICCWISIAATFCWFCYKILTSTDLTDFFCSFLILIIPFVILGFLYLIENKKTEKIIKKIAKLMAIAMFLIAVLGFIPAYQKQEIKSLAGKTMYYNTDSYVNGYLNVRESPKGDVVYSLKKGESVILTGKASISLQLNHWFWAETEDGYWVSFRILTTQKK